MSFGNFSSTRLPTDHGIFDIHVLPEAVSLAPSSGRPVFAIREHYAMVPKDLSKSGSILFHVHSTNLIEDLFRPAIEGTISKPRQLLSEINRNGHQILLYVDGVAGQAMDGAEINSCSLTSNSIHSWDIVDKFADHLKLGKYGARIPNTPVVRKASSAKIETSAITMNLYQLNEVMAVDVPTQVQELLFPELREAPIFVKELTHFAVVNSRTVFDEPTNPPFVRVHSSCATGDINAAHTCDCGEQFYQAMREVVANGGAVVYDDAEGRGAHSLAAKMAFYQVSKELNLNTYAAMERFGYSRDVDGYGPDLRTFVGPGKLMQQVGLGRVILGTNNPHKIQRLERQGIIVLGSQRVLTENMAPERAKYLNGKLTEGGHLLSALDLSKGPGS